MVPICSGVKVQLTGQDGNAFFIMARVTKAMRQAHIEQETIASFTEEAMSGDYDNLIRVCTKYVEVA